MNVNRKKKLFLEIYMDYNHLFFVVSARGRHYSKKVENM
jgi:hypothetical protein